MFLCDRCQNLEALALAPSGTRNFVDFEPEQDVCFSCLGLLQQFACKKFIVTFCDLIAAQKFQHKYLRASLLLPSCLYLRQQLILRKSESLQNGVDLRISLLKRMSYLKAAWRELCVPYIEKTLGIKHIDGDGTHMKEPFFDVLVTFDYSLNDLECSPLRPYFAKRLQHVKPLKRPVDEYTGSLEVAPSKNLKPSQFTLLSVLDAICCVPNEDMDKYVASIEKEIEKHPAVPMSLQISPTFLSQSIYVTGRYRKLCRDLPQSAWTADDADAEDVVDQGSGYNMGRYSTSIEQLIGDPLVSATSATGYRFSAAGREDVDVRMLGSGRPFALQLLNPKVPFALTPGGVNEHSLNAMLSKHHVVITNLDENFTRTTLDILKHGEGQKEKEYTAVCFFRVSTGPMPTVEDICKKINSIQCPLALNQRTPIRVLHRRSPTIRVRHILSLSAVPFSNTQSRLAFILRMKTEAGTYVKEFVHGDFGRTTPNIAQIIAQDIASGNSDANLDVECDIVALDVTDISEVVAGSNGHSQP